MTQPHDNDIELQNTDIQGNAQNGNSAEGGRIEAPGNNHDNQQHIEQQNVVVPPLDNRSQSHTSASNENMSRSTHSSRDYAQNVRHHHTPSPSPHSRTDLARPDAGTFTAYQNEASNQDRNLARRHQKATVVLSMTLVAIVALVVVLAAVLGTRHDSTRSDSDSGSDDTVSGRNLA